MNRKRQLIQTSLLCCLMVLFVAGSAKARVASEILPVPQPGMAEAIQHKADVLKQTEVLPLMARHQRIMHLTAKGSGEKALSYYDMISLTSVMDFDLAAGSVDAETKVIIESLEDGLTQAGFWLDPLESSTVEADGVEVTYTQMAGGYILVDLPAPLNAGEQLSIYFFQEGEPDCSAGFFGMQFCNLDEDITYFGGPSFVPTRLSYSGDDLLDDFDLEFVLIVPEEYESAASADLTSLIDNGDGTFSHVYGSDLSNDINFAVAKFDVFEAASQSGVPSFVYTLPGHSTYGQAWADMDADIIDLYESRYCDYQYPKIDAIQVIPELGGGFATLSAVFIYEGAFDQNPGIDYFAEGIFAHELGHEWWAYMIPLLEHTAPWLNEGFAEFSANLFSYEVWEQYYVDYAYDWNAQQIMYLVDPTDELPLSQMDLSEISQDAYFLITYQKGAYVLRMLRHVLGDEDFFSGMRAWAESGGSGGATTNGFQTVMEDASGEDLDAFFEQWVWGTGWPHYRHGFDVEGDEESGYTVSVTVDQVQEELFDMPVPIHLFVETGQDNEDGDPEVEEFLYTEQISERSQTFTYEVDHRVHAVQFDPRDLVLARKEPALAGDIDGSGEVDGYDMFYMAYGYDGSIYDYTSHWLGYTDLNFDGETDDEDIALFEANFGKGVWDEE